MRQRSISVFGPNCTDIGYTKQVELKKAGIPLTIMACRRGRAFLLTLEGVTDNRTVGCE
jgi:hypothetical protein